MYHVTVAQSHSYFRCPACGKNLQQGSKACPYCGWTTVVPQTPPSAYGQAIQPTIYQPKPKSNSAAIWIFCILLFTCCGLPLFGIFGHSPDSTDSPPTPPSPSEASATQAPTEAQKVIDPVRGVKPVPSEWDGITPEANEYLRETLKDYDSMKIVECSPVVEWKEDRWAQRVKYRAKNSFGAYDLAEQLFVIRDGTVTDVIDLSSISTTGSNQSSSNDGSTSGGDSDPSSGTSSDSG